MSCHFSKHLEDMVWVFFFAILKYAKVLREASFDQLGHFLLKRVFLRMLKGMNL